MALNTKPKGMKPFPYTGFARLFQTGEFPFIRGFLGRGYLNNRTG